MADTLKDNPDPQAQPGPGHNNADEVTMDSARFHACLRQLEEIDAERHALNEKKKRIRRTMKAEGIMLGEMDAARKEQGLTPEELARNVYQRNLFRRWMGLAPGEQAEMFPKEPKADEKDSPRARGYRHGESGNAEKDNPYAPGSQQGQQWLEGYNEGFALFMKEQERLANDLAKPEEPKAAKPKKPKKSDDDKTEAEQTDGEKKPELVH